MPGSRHLRVRIQTSASPKDVFAVMRGMTSALPDSLRDFSSIGVPAVSTRPPKFRIGAPSRGGGDAPVAWVGEVTEQTVTGSLIIAHTSRSAALWQGGVGVAVCFVTIVWAGSTRQLGFGTLFVMSTLISIFATTGWVRSMRLPDRDKRNALLLIDFLVKRLP